MYFSYKRVFLFLTLTGALASNGPGNIIGINNVIDIPNKIPAIPGFGPKNDTGGTTTVMGTYGDIIPGFTQNILENNKTGSNSSGTSSNNGGNFGSLISDIPNKIFPNKTGGNNGIPGYGIISGIPILFGNNKTNSDNSSGGIPDFGSFIPEYFGNKNKTNSGNANETDSENGNGSNSGFPDISAYIPGLMKKNKTFGSNNGSSNSGISFIPYRPSFPNNIFGTNNNDTGDNSNPLTGINFGSISGIPDKVFGNDKGNKTIVKRHCHEHKEEHEHDEEKERDRRQIASGLGSLGSLVPGGSNLSSIGSALGSADSGDATLVLGMFQVLVKPIKTPSLNTVTDIIQNPQAGISDIIKNPQNILTQPQTLLNGGK